MERNYRNSVDFTLHAVEDCVYDCVLGTTSAVENVGILCWEHAIGYLRFVHYCYGIYTMVRYA